MSLSYLTKRNGHFYFRVWIPLDIRHHFGRNELVRSLRTTNYTNAKSLVKSMAGRTDQLFTIIRTGHLTELQIKKLVDEFVVTNIQKFEDGRNMEGFSAFPAATIEDMKKADKLLNTDNRRQEYLENLKFRLKYNHFEEIEGYVDGVIEANGLNVQKPSSEYYQLCREFLKGYIFFHTILTERAAGNYLSEHEKTLETMKQAPAVAAPVPAEQPEAKAVLISEVSKEYIDEKKPSDKYLKRIQRAHKLFIEHVGDIPLLNVQRSDVPAFIKKLENTTKLKAGTLIDYQKQIVALVNWADDSNKIPKSFVKGLPLIEKNRDDNRERYYDDDIEQVVTGLVNEFKGKGRLHRPEWFFIPLIALYTGMRQNEICQLYVNDVVQIKGNWYFDVNDKEDKKIDKGDSCARLVPIHNHLVELGFLDYYENVKSLGHQRVWPNLKRSKDGYYSSALCQWYAVRINYRYVRKNGKTNLNKSFHSFRHTVSNRLKNAFVAYEMREEIIGHAFGTEVAQGYAGDFDPSPKHEAISKLDFGIDFGPLKEIARRLIVQ